MKIKGIKKPEITKELVAELQEELQEVRKAVLKASRRLEGLPTRSKGKKVS